MPSSEAMTSARLSWSGAAPPASSSSPSYIRHAHSVHTRLPNGAPHRGHARAWSISQRRERHWLHRSSPMASHPTHRVGHSTSSNPAPSAFAAAAAPEKRARLRMHPSIRPRWGAPPSLQRDRRHRMPGRHLAPWSAHGFEPRRHADITGLVRQAKQASMQAAATKKPARHIHARAGQATAGAYAGIAQEQRLHG